MGQNRLPGGEEIQDLSEGLVKVLRKIVLNIEPALEPE
jgi:hypothetical protein